MRFEIYTELTVRQCMNALNERMAASPTKSRPAVAGQIDKGGKFSISVTNPVALAFKRRTRLRGQAERSTGLTTITGYVPDGLPRARVAVIMAALVLVGVAMMANGNGVYGILITIIGLGLYVPLVGDYHNGTYLYKELKKATKAKERPPS